MGLLYLHHTLGSSPRTGPQTQSYCQGCWFLLCWGARVSSDTHVTSLNGSGQGRGDKEPRGEIPAQWEGNTAPLLALERGLSFCLSLQGFLCFPVTLSIPSLLGNIC